MVAPSASLISTLRSAAMRIKKSNSFTSLRHNGGHRRRLTRAASHSRRNRRSLHFPAPDSRAMKRGNGGKVIKGSVSSHGRLAQVERIHLSGTGRGAIAETIIGGQSLGRRYCCTAAIQSQALKARGFPPIPEGDSKEPTSSTPQHWSNRRIPVGQEDLVRILSNLFSMEVARLVGEHELASVG